LFAKIRFSIFSPPLDPWFILGNSLLILVLKTILFYLGLIVLKVKEVSIVWFLYTASLHARFTRGWVDVAQRGCQ